MTNNLQTNGVSLTTPKGWNLAARGANTVTILALSAALGFMVYYTKEGFASITREHQHLQRQIAISTCIQTLTPGERQALNFNTGAPWKRFCWWMDEN